MLHLRSFCPPLGPLDAARDEVWNSFRCPTPLPRSPVWMPPVRWPGRGAWVAQSAERPTSAQVVSSWFVSSSPASGLLLSAQTPLRILCLLSLSLSAPSLLTLSLSKINKTLKKKKKKKRRPPRAIPARGTLVSAAPTQGTKGSLFRVSGLGTQTFPFLTLSLRGTDSVGHCIGFLWLP